ncbi:MAG: hypothetical protein R3A44_25555 [Caldilineaceae bacterium]
MVDIIACMTTIDLVLKPLDWGMTILEIGGLLKNDLEEILRDNQRIWEELKAVTKRLQRLEYKLEEQILRDMQIGVTHLVNGIVSNVEDVKVDEFRMARSKFANLVALSPHQKTLNVDNEFLIGLGYWGNYHYFNLRQDPRSALIQVYECTEKYPDIGLQVFPQFLILERDIDGVKAKRDIEYYYHQKGDLAWLELALIKVETHIKVFEGSPFALALKEADGTVQRLMSHRYTIEHRMNRVISDLSVFRNSLIDEARQKRQDLENLRR